MRVAECFLSLQGEGITIGRLAYFIRLQGCSLRCSWCDTAWSRDPAGGVEMSIPGLVEMQKGAYDVCVTGGEPLEQPDVPELVDALLEAGHRVTVETNGAADISPIAGDPGIIISMDVKCPSSGMQDRFRPENLQYMWTKDQLKFVIADATDLAYAEGFIRHYDIRSEIIFSAVGGIDIKELAEHVVAEKLDVRVLPQLHKIIWGDRRGVRANFSKN